MTPLSVVIITYNEEQHIGRCLDSVKPVSDDVVVVDSFSSDHTKDICEEKNARFISHEFEGHIEQKNFAFSQAKYPHILSLDADESLSKELQQSILNVKKAWQFDGYYMNRLNNFCGKWIRFGSWNPDRKLRLMDSRKGKWTGVNPHDKFELSVGSTTGYIKGDLLHFTAETEEQYRGKMSRYAVIAAAALNSKNKTTNRITIFIKTIAAFIISYLFRLGFLDGAAGWKVSKLSALYTFWKYSNLLSRQKIK